MNLSMFRVLRLSCQYKLQIIKASDFDQIDKIINKSVVNVIENEWAAGIQSRIPSFILGSG